MKLFPALILSVTFLNSFSQSYTMCTASFTLNAVNSDSLANPTYSIEPGQASNQTGSFVVSPAVTTSYTLYVTGTDTTSALVTTSTTATVHVIPPPTFTVASSDNFTLGCGTHSAATATIVPVGSPAVTFTWLAPGTSTLLSWPLSTVSVYTITAPGAHTAVVREDVCGHETRIAVHFIMNTILPVFDSVLVSPGLTCKQDSVTIRIFTDADSLAWQGPPVGQTPTGTVHTAFLPGTYTITGFNLSNGCPGQTTAVVPDLRIYTQLQHDTVYSLCNVPTVAITVTVTNPTGHDSLTWYNNLGQTLAYGPTYTASAVGKYMVTATNDYGCITNALLSVLGCAGIPSGDISPLSCWPNPAQDMITITFEGNRERPLSIYSLSGQLLKRYLVRSGAGISLAELSPGLYILESEGRNKKLVKE